MRGKEHSEGRGAQCGDQSPWGQEPSEGTGARGDRCLASLLSEDRRWSRSRGPSGEKAPCLQALVGPGQGAREGRGVHGQGGSACASLCGYGLSVLCSLACPALWVQT